MKNRYVLCRQDYTDAGVRFCFIDCQSQRRVFYALSDLVTNATFLSLLDSASCRALNAAMAESSR